MDGVDCLTKQLGIEIPRSELTATKYPSGLKFPEFQRKSKFGKSGKSRHAKVSEPEPAIVAESCSSDSDGSVAAKFAVSYHTINTSTSRYDSMSDGSEFDSDETPTPKPKPTKPTKKSATTKARPI